MKGNKISKTQMANLVKGVINEELINEQNWVFCCEPGSCGCMPEIIPQNPPCNGQTTYANSQDCQNDLNNCCTMWTCDPNGAGICEPTGDPNAPFSSENACLAQYPQGCGLPVYYDCTQATGYQCNPVTYNSGMSQGQCNSTFPQGCAPQNNYECDTVQCNCNADINGSFTGPTALADCQAALSDPAHDCCCDGPCGGQFDCIDRTIDGVVTKVCVPTPTGPFSSMNDCQTCIANPNCPECNDPEDRWNCIDELDGDGAPTGNKICVTDPSGVFATEPDCLNCVADPGCERCNEGESKWECVPRGIEPKPVTGISPVGPTRTNPDVILRGEKQQGGMLREQQGGNMICIPDPNGQFALEVDCLNCVADPDCPECNEGGGWECVEGAAMGCQDTGQGPYPDQATCEANTDDHYNMGFCDCNCPGQPQGCDAEPLISTIPIINGEYNGIHGQPYHVGNVDLNLNDAKDKDGPLISQAFRDRMAPCGPSYRAPGGNVEHDCKFWEFIAEVKLPNKYSSVIHPASAGGLANVQAENPWHMAHATAPLTGGTALGGYPFLPWVPNPVTGVLEPVIHATTGLPINPYGGVQSTTAHPRWQRRLEAKIAYVSCLRRNCCMNTQWPDTGAVFTPFM